MCQCSSDTTQRQKGVKSDAPELGLPLLMEAVHKAVGLALQRPPQGDTASAAQLLRVSGENFHRLRESDELGRSQALERAILLERRKAHTHTHTHSVT